MVVVVVGKGTVCRSVRVGNFSSLLPLMRVCAVNTIETEGDEGGEKDDWNAVLFLLLFLSPHARAPKQSTHTLAGRRAWKPTQRTDAQRQRK